MINGDTADNKNADTAKNNNNNKPWIGIFVATAYIELAKITMIFEIFDDNKCSITAQMWEEEDKIPQIEYICYNAEYSILSDKKTGDFTLTLHPQNGTGNCGDEDFYLLQNNGQLKFKMDANNQEEQGWIDNFKLEKID